MKLTALMGAGVSVLVIAGCGGTDEPASQVDPEEAFVQELRRTYPNPSFLQNEKAREAIVGQGEAVCGMEKDGFTENEMNEVMVDAGMDPAAIGPVIDAAKDHLC